MSKEIVFESVTFRLALFDIVRIFQKVFVHILWNFHFAGVVTGSDSLLVPFVTGELLIFLGIEHDGNKGQTDKHARACDS